MGGVVAHPELAPDDLGDALPCPAVTVETPRQGSPSEQRRHLGLLFRRQARHATGSRAVVQGGLAFLASTGEPLADGAVGDAEGFGNLTDLPALLGERPGAQPTAFGPTGRLV